MSKIRESGFPQRQLLRWLHFTARDAFLRRASSPEARNQNASDYSARLDFESFRNQVWFLLMLVISTRAAKSATGWAPMRTRPKGTGPPGITFTATLRPESTVGGFYSPWLVTRVGRATTIRTNGSTRLI